MSFWAYILRCSDNSYYTGHTDNLDGRVGQRQSGLTPGYPQQRRPVALVWSQDFSTRLDPLEAERRIKGWSRAKKEALIAGDWQRLSILARNHQDGPSTGSGRTAKGSGVSPPLVRPEPVDRYALPEEHHD